MPAILDRCVTHLQDRGVNTSSAYAICTASLQRAGKIPRGRSKKEYDVEFSEWAKRVDLPPDFTESLHSIWEHFTPGDANLLKTLRKVSVLDEDQSAFTNAAQREKELARKKRILGEARLHSKVIALNPKALSRLGGHPVWIGAVALHEAQHATYGFGEHEATHAEQRWLGKLFAEHTLDFNKPAMMLTMRAAAVAQAQREKDVHHAHRAKDFYFLNSVGFTPRASRKIVAMGRAMEKYRKERVRQEQEEEKLASAMNLVRAKDYYDFLDGDLDLIEKTVDADLADAYDLVVEKTFFPVVHGVERLLTASDPDTTARSGGGVEPSLGTPIGAWARPGMDRAVVASDAPVPLAGRRAPSNPYRDDDRYMITADTPTPWTTVVGMMERYVNRSVERRVGKELRGPLGVVPALRRAGWDAKNLPDEWRAKRLASLKECLPSLRSQGLFDENGDVTDAHLLCLLHAWTPVPHLVFDGEDLDVVLT